MAKIKPLGDRILVKRLKEEQKTKSGIIIPDTAKEKPRLGEVIAVGDGKLLDNGQVVPLKVKVGDKVLFGKYAGTEIDNSLIEGAGDEDEYLIMNEDEILAVVE